MTRLTYVTLSDKRPFSHHMCKKYIGRAWPNWLRLYHVVVFHPPYAEVHRFDDFFSIISFFYVILSLNIALSFMFMFSKNSIESSVSRNELEHGRTSVNWSFMLVGCSREFFYYFISRWFSLLTRIFGTMFKVGEVPKCLETNS